MDYLSTKKNISAKKNVVWPKSMYGFDNNAEKVYIIPNLPREPL